MKEYFKRRFQIFMDLVGRRMPSDLHREKFKEYEFYLMLRTNFSQIVRFIHFLLATVMGTSYQQVSASLIEEGAIPNAEFAKEVQPYARSAIIALNMGRLVLLLISLKNLKIAKTYFYYEAVYFIVE